MSVNATEPYSWNSGVVSRGFERCVLTGRHGVAGKNALEFLGAAALGRQPGVDMLGLQINDAAVVAGSGDVGGIGFEAPGDIEGGVFEAPKEELFGFVVVQSNSKLAVQFADGLNDLGGVAHGSSLRGRSMGGQIRLTGFD